MNSTKKRKTKLTNTHIRETHLKEVVCSIYYTTAAIDEKRHLAVRFISTVLF